VVRVLEQDEPRVAAEPEPGEVAGLEPLEPAECDLRAATDVERQALAGDGLAYKLERCLHLGGRRRVVLADVRRAGHDANAVGNERPRDRERRVDVLHAVVEPRQDVAVEVDHARPA
jgi:hypothetical protein